MITNILKLFVALAILVTFSTNVSAQQPFDSLPTEDATEQAQDDAIRVAPDPSQGVSPDSTYPEDDEPDQNVVVEEKFAGWWAAGQGRNGGRLSDDLRANWVVTDPNGLISGTVSGVDGAETSGMVVYLLNQGRLVTNVFVDAEGNFELNNVVEGAYSLVGIGDNAFFCFSVNILHHTERPPEDRNAPTELNIMAFQNKTTINNDWIRYFAPQVKFRVFGRYNSGEGEGDPAAQYGFEGLAQFQPKAAPATSINSHQVTKTADGRLLGRVHQFNSITGRPVNVRNTKVMLLKGDAVHSSTTTDNFGVFEFDAVDEGQYALVAASIDGLGCIGIDVVDSAGAGDSSTVFDFTMASAETVGWLNHIASELAYERAILAPRPQEPAAGNQGCQFCAGNGCNSCRREGPFRRAIKGIDDLFERAFYGNTGGGGYGGYGGGYGGYGGYGGGYGGIYAPGNYYGN